jgi:hypothetical protein
MLMKRRLSFRSKLTRADSDDLPGEVRCSVIDLYRSGRDPLFAAKTARRELTKNNYR